MGPWIDVATGLACGALFGFVLENAGFGSPRKLTAQFRLSDWSVFKVMFTAIVVAALGLAVLTAAGWLPADEIFVPEALLGAAAIGGALVGAGFAVGGYCPGTSVVGLCSGRLDALVFLLGLLLGTVGFAAGFGLFEPWTTAGAFAGGDTLSDWLHVPSWALGLLLAAVAVVVFRVGSGFEARAGGAVTAQQALQDEPTSWTGTPSRSSRSLTSGDFR